LTIKRLRKEHDNKIHQLEQDNEMTIHQLGKELTKNDTLDTKIDEQEYTINILNAKLIDSLKYEERCEELLAINEENIILRSKAESNLAEINRKTKEFEEEIKFLK